MDDFDGQVLDEFSETLTDKQLEVPEKCDEAMNEMHSVTEIETFPCGFRLGDRQMILEMIWCCFTAATAQMKNGGECDLVVCLCEEKELGLDKADLL